MTNIEIRAINVLLLGVSCLFLSSCTKTVGEEFREIVADIDAQCKRDRMGPYLDKNDPEYKNKKAQTTCDILSIKPADPLATEEGRFAYSIKLPEPHNKSNVQYNKGMSAENYFKELCEKDAGEWIFRTVEGVEGVFQGRQDIPSYQDRRLVYWLFEYHEMTSSNMEDYLVQPSLGRYNYMERPRNSNETGKPYVRFFHGAEVLGHSKIDTWKHGRVPYIVNKEQTDTLNSRYSYTWRQIINNDMLENGISGGETIIYDRTTGEILAFRRFFGRMWPRGDSKYTRMSNGDLCMPSFTGRVREFTQKVLVPINPAE